MNEWVNTAAFCSSTLLIFVTRDTQSGIKSNLVATPRHIIISGRNGARGSVKDLYCLVCKAPQRDKRESLLIIQVTYKGSRRVSHKFVTRSRTFLCSPHHALWRSSE